MSVVGIDLGTTNTVVACVRQGKVHVLADEHGQRLLPSVVSFHPNGEVLVGAAGKARRIIDPKNTVYSHKRLIGRSWGSPEIVQAKQRFAFELREGPGQGPLVHARGQDYTLPEISAFVLKRARQIAETALGTAVERAVITVPAHFNELQRASTKVAGRVSGVEVLRILNEPTAAALAYGLGRSGNERVAVYDFGGGTFDCTLLDLNGNVFEVLATAGDSFLGGDDVDNMIAERMAESYLQAHRYDPRSDAQMFERLKTTAEEMKMALSHAETHTVVLTDFGFGGGGSSINYTFTMTRRDLDAMITPLVDRTFKVTQDALSLARLTPTSFDKVILVGGSTRIPLVRKRVEAFFGAPPMDRVNPDEVVAIGAAIQAAALTEGTKKRSIPAPPPVMGRTPATQRGLPNDLDATQSGATGARAPSQPDQTRGPRKITSPGVAPATQPLGARASAPSAPNADEDPSIASFPDLRVPTPFEWFPSSAKPTPAADESFGTIDEPPSMMSTPSASVPSFPSMASGAGGMPSPVGEPEPFGAAPTTDKDAFGHVSDLSLISTNTEAAAMEAITSARQKAPLDFDDSGDTEAIVRTKDARGNVPGRMPAPPAPDEPDLPAVVQTADLPAVSSKNKRPEIRKPAPIAPTQSGSSAMIGKPPPPVAPQPFGPMDRVEEEPAPASRTAAMPGRPPRVPATVQSAVRAPAPMNATAPMAARPAPPIPKPLNTTAPLEQRSPVAATQMSPVGYAPSPPPPQAYPSAPPPPVAQPYPSSPPAPVAAPSQPPPIFGSFSSAPPAADPYAQLGSGGYEHVSPGAPPAPQNLQFAAPVLVDVTPRALVVETAGGYTDTIIPRNSKIPCERTRRFATGRDMQTTVRVRVAQGEQPYFPQNTFLGEVELSGLRPAPRGEVVVAVTFEVDADGTMRVRARDVQTGQEARATLQLVGVADESSVVMMINRFAQQPVGGGGPGGPGYPL